MGGMAKIAIPVGLGLTGFGLAGMGPLAGVLSGASTAAGGAVGTGAAAGFGGADMFAPLAGAGTSFPIGLTANSLGTGVNLLDAASLSAPGINLSAIPGASSAFDQGLASGGFGTLVDTSGGTMPRMLLKSFAQILNQQMQPPPRAPVANISVQHPAASAAALPSFQQISPYEQQRQAWLASLGRA